MTPPAQPAFAPIRGPTLLSVLGTFARSAEPPPHEYQGAIDHPYATHTYAGRATVVRGDSGLETALGEGSFTIIAGAIDFVSSEMD